MKHKASHMTRRSSDHIPHFDPDLSCSSAGDSGTLFTGNGFNKTRGSGNSAEGSNITLNNSVQLMIDNTASVQPATSANIQRDYNKLNDFENGWGVPNKVAAEMIEIFFENIQPWMGIIHRPLFYQRYEQRKGQTECLVDRDKITPTESIMIFAMFALAARFSTAAFFEASDPVVRGDVFAERAAVIKDPILRTVEEPSLEMMKGCVLLACYCLTAGRLPSGAVLTSACVRMAYNLGLNAIDEDQIRDDGTVDEIDLQSPEDWIHKEELRRLWWAITDLDTFVCTLSCQPYGVDRRRMRVLLPVSDTSWYEGVPMRSSALLFDSRQTWKTLHGLPHQSGRNWFLVSNHLIFCIAEAALQPSRLSEDQLTELESALSCLRLALPANFQLKTLFIDANNIAEGNWIISTHLMVLACETILERLKIFGPLRSNGSGLTDELKRFSRRFTSVLVNIAQVWLPEYIPLAHPIMCCALINPWDIAFGSKDSGNIPSFELSELLLAHFARYWKLGTASLRMISILKDDCTNIARTPTSEERLMMKHFSILDPARSRKRAWTTSSSSHHSNESSKVNEPLAPSQDVVHPSGSDIDKPEDLLWPQMNIWDHFQDLEADPTDFSMLNFSPNFIPIN
jgi:hypothetical protein